MLDSWLFIANTIFMLKQHFAVKIKETRESLNLTQKEFADKIIVSPCRVNNWENEVSTPTAEDLVVISGVFCISTDYLLGLKDCNKIKNK